MWKKGPNFEGETGDLDSCPTPYLKEKELPLEKAFSDMLIVDRHIRLLSSQGMDLCAKHKGSTE